MNPNEDYVFILMGLLYIIGQTGWRIGWLWRDYRNGRAQRNKNLPRYPACSAQLGAQRASSTPRTDSGDSYSGSCYGPRYVDPVDAVAEYSRTAVTPSVADLIVYASRGEIGSGGRSFAEVGASQAP